MRVNYRLELYDAFGTLMPIAFPYFSGKYVRAENGIGAMTLRIPGNISGDYFKWHGRIAIWRSIDAGPEVLAEDTIWLINKRIFTRQGKEAYWDIEAACLNSILNTRLVDYNAGNSYSLKLAAADDMGKAVVRENLGSSVTDTTRDLSTYLSVDGDVTLAPVVRKAFENQRVIDILQDLAQDSFRRGTYLVFDITSTNPPSGFTFKSYTQYRGLDHRYPSGAAGPLIIGPDFGNFGDTEVIFDHSEVFTRAIISGTNVDTTYAKARANNTALQAQSPFGIIENQRSTNNQVADAELLTTEANSFLEEGRDKVLVSGKLIQTPNFVYGIHWGWGDFITVQINGANYDMHVSKVEVPLTSQDDVDAQISALLRTE